MTCHYSTSLHRRCHATVHRPSITQHHILAGHLESSFDSRSLSSSTRLMSLRTLLLHLTICFFRRASPFFTLARFYIYSVPTCSGSACVLSLFFFFVKSCSCLCAVLLCSARASSFSSYASLCLSFLCYSVTQVEDGYM